MRLATFRKGQTGILYDADSLCDAHGAPQIDPQIFDPEYWRRMDKVVGEAPGRGASLFLDADDNEQWVLRPYRRGGLIARLSNERYLWFGAERSRAFREMRLTAQLYAQGLPVPRPIAAGVMQHGLTYRADLITVRLSGARALADCLTEADDTLLQRVGSTIRRFHDVGLDHVDLNARNLLIDQDKKVWLIDLDRCRLRRPGKWQQANLTRLERSLHKHLAPDIASHVTRQIQYGYG
ncbi:3-deoxy-D-manno-octulosonic acid kinase [Halomonas halmophila]|uniref:3-deoxy-D-manno-octulosonic acid kinase n=1 Tax=Halomonas halmophila TaxID=252 RepID=A0A4Y4F4W5_9GAMM|nr:3-deoxy-D-manno-octulosonic acid kinase [Halomonas halmophila]GED22640.1 3-deoxy-D-manno-octulosonic acid kinase [Halomonas halmophila]